MGQTVNLLLRLRWFESTFPHQKVPAIAGAFSMFRFTRKLELIRFVNKNLVNKDTIAQMFYYVKRDFTSFLLFFG